MRILLAIAIGGALGAVTRSVASDGAKRLLGEDFPWGTLFVNVVGCFLLGLVVEFGFARKELSPTLYRGFAVGFLGALTTFSTFGHETFRRLEEGRVTLAFGNIAANMFVGLFAVWVGVLVGKAWFDVPLPK